MELYFLLYFKTGMKRNNNKNGTEFITKHKRLMFQRLVMGCVELDIKPVRNYIIINFTK